MGFFKKLWRINFSTHSFWNICDGKNFSFTDISKSMREKLILHRFWKIPLFPVILSWIIYDNELKTVKYISPTKSIRRENVRHILYYITHRRIKHFRTSQFCAWILKQSKALPIVSESSYDIRKLTNQFSFLQTMPWHVLV